MPRIITVESTGSSVNTEGFQSSAMEGGTTKQKDGTRKTTAESLETVVRTTEDQGAAITFTVKLNGIC
jgi:hypothetical protein